MKRGGPSRLANVSWVPAGPASTRCTLVDIEFGFDAWAECGDLAGVHCCRWARQQLLEMRVAFLGGPSGSGKKTRSLNNMQ